MTSLYFNLQGRLAQLRSTGELLTGDYGRDVGAANTAKFWVMFPVRTMGVKLITALRTF